MLTAAHNVGAGQLLIRVGGDREYRASIVSAGSGEAADLALLEITDSPFGHELDLVRFARVDRSSAVPVSGCWAVGFPRFKEKAQSSRAAPQLRDSAHLRGEILPGANLVSGLLELQVTATPRPLPPGEMGGSEWQGISGAVVFGADAHSGDCAVGVVVEHHRPEGESSLTVVPITALETIRRAEERRRWWDLLGVVDPSQLAVLPRPTERRPPDYWATVQEIAQRAPVLLERDEDLSDLAAFATGTEGYRWLVGRPWAGKSSLVAHFARACPPQVDCVAYFLVRRLSDADSSRFTAVVSTQLAWLLDQDAPAKLDDPDVLRSLWVQGVERAEQTGRHLLLVVDGLDEDLSRQLSRPSVAALLPSRAGDRAHVLVTSRPYPELPGDVDAEHPLRQVQPVELAPSVYAGALAQRATQELDQLLDQRDGDELAVDLIALLTAAEGALSIHDLTELAHQDQARVRRREVEQVVTWDIARLLQPTGATPDYRRYTFAHDLLHQRSINEFDDELADYRARIFTWAEDYRLRGWPNDATPVYFFDAYPTLLAREAADKLRALLTDLAYIDSAIARVGVDRIASHLHKAQDKDLADTDLAAIGWCLDQDAHHLRPPYPLDKPGYAIRQLCLQALKGRHVVLAEQARQQLMKLPRPRLVPRWTSRRTSRALVRTLVGHTSRVNAVAITSDGSRAVSGGEDGTLRRWDLTTGRQLGDPLTGHTGEVTAVAITPDGSRAVSASQEDTLRRWDLTTGRQLGDPLTGHTSWVNAVAISSDGSRAVSASQDGTLRQWDLTTGRQLGDPLTGHTGRVNAVAITPDGRRAVSAGEDRTLRRWDLTTGRQLGDPLTRTGFVEAVAISADGTRAVSGGGTLRRWDLSRGRRVGGPLTGHEEKVYAVAITPDGSRAVSGGWDGTVRRWDLTTGRQVGGPLTGHDGAVTAVAISSDGSRAVSGGSDGTVRQWDLSNSQQLGDPLTGHTRRVNAVAITPDGSRAVSGGEDRTLRRWDLSSGRQIGDPLTGHDDEVYAVAISSDGKRAVSAGEDGMLRRWDLTTGRQLGDPLTGHDDEVTAVAISSDGSRAVSGGSDGMLRQWDLGSGRQIGGPLTGHDDGVIAVAISSDGKRAVSAGEDRTLRRWDLTTGRQLGDPLTWTGWVTAVAITPDGTRAVGAIYVDYVYTLQQWDLSTGRQVGDSVGRQAGDPLTGHDDEVTAVAITPDGSRAISASEDRTLQVWELATGKSIDMVALDAVTNDCAIASDPDGFQVIGGDSLGAITAWLLHAG